MEKPGKKLKTFFMILGVTGAVYGVFRFLLPLVAPFIAAWGIAAVLRPSARWIAEHSRICVKIPDVICRRWPGIEKICSKEGKDCAGARRICLHIPAGAAGVAELLVILAAVLGGLIYGGRLLWLEFSSFLDQLPQWISRSDAILTGLCHRMETGFHLKKEVLVLLVREMLKGLLENIKKGAMPYLMANSMTVFHFGTELTIFLFLAVISVGMILQEDDHWKIRSRKSVFHKEIALIVSRIGLVTSAYFKTQGLLLLVTSALCTGTFYFMGNPYYILAGLGTGLLDALPVFGTGTVLIPWAVILCFGRQWGRAAALLVLYAVCYVLREILESKWMGRQVGLTPLENLIAIFTGLRLFGLAGLFLGPLGLLLIRDLVVLDHMPP